MLTTMNLHEALQVHDLITSSESGLHCNQNHHDFAYNRLSAVDYAPLLPDMGFEEWLVFHT